MSDHSCPPCEDARAVRRRLHHIAYDLNEIVVEIDPDNDLHRASERKLAISTRDRLVDLINRIANSPPESSKPAQNDTLAAVKAQLTSLSIALQMLDEVADAHTDPATVAERKFTLAVKHQVDAILDLCSEDAP